MPAKSATYLGETILFVTKSLDHSSSARMASNFFNVAAVSEYSSLPISLISFDLRRLVKVRDKFLGSFVYSRKSLFASQLIYVAVFAFPASSQAADLPLRTILGLLQTSLAA